MAKRASARPPASASMWPASARSARLPDHRAPATSTTRNPHVSARVAVSRPRERAAAVSRCAYTSIVRIVAGSGGSGPEAILARLLPLIFAKLGRPAVFQAPDVHLGEGRDHPVSPRIDRRQRDDHVAVGQHVVHVDGERAAGELHRATKEAPDLVVALVGAREGTRLFSSSRAFP